MSAAEGARGEILARIRASHRLVEQPPARASVRSFADQVERFSQSLAAVKGEVRLTRDLAAAWLQVDVVLEEAGAESVVANDEDPIAGVDLQARWPQRRCHVAGVSSGGRRFERG